MNFSNWLHQELMTFNTSGKESDFEIDYQEFLCVIEGAIYPSYNFLARLICYLDLETKEIGEMIKAVSEDTKLSSDTIYVKILEEMSKMQEENLSLLRSCFAKS